MTGDSHGTATAVFFFIVNAAEGDKVPADTLPPVAFPDEAARQVVPARFAWWHALLVWIGSLLASLIGASIGLAISGEDAEDYGWVTWAGATGAQFLATIFGCLLVCRLRGTGSLRRDLGLIVRFVDWWWLLCGVGLYFVAAVMITPLVNLVAIPFFNLCLVPLTVLATLALSFDAFVSWALPLAHAAGSSWPARAWSPCAASTPSPSRSGPRSLPG